MVNINEFAKRKEYLDLLEMLLVSKKDTVVSFLADRFKDNCIKNTLSIVVNIDNVKDNIALVSHYDTVHNDKDDRELVADRKSLTYWSPDGLGADDRAGIWANIVLYEYCIENDIPAPVLIFTDLEEVGGIGAEEVANIYATDLNHLNYLIEIDRKGDGEAVFYNNEPKDFIKYIEDFGFIEEYGSFSDITTLGLATNLCSVNLSAGYYKQHTKTEHLRLNHLLYTMEAVVNMIQDNIEQNKKWELPEYIEDKFTYPYHYSYDYSYGKKTTKDTKPAYENCDYCNKIINVKSEEYFTDDYLGIYCSSCVANYQLNSYMLLYHIEKKSEVKNEKKKKVIKFDKKEKRIERQLKVISKIFPSDYDTQKPVLSKLTTEQLSDIVYVAINSDMELAEIMKRTGITPVKKKAKVYKANHLTK